MRPQKRITDSDPGSEFYELFEFEEYLKAFKSSTDRARYMVFINTAVSVVILICTWNVSGWSWSMNRLKLAEESLRKNAGAEFDRFHPGKVPPERAKSVPDPTSAQGWKDAREDFIDRTARKDRAEIYRQYLLEQVTFAPLPGLGLHVHTNDIGIIGGFALTILMLLLCFAMVREHENLCLSLFKINRICERNRNTRHDGESTANFLYHALAMGQVLSNPPTLHRWGYGSRSRFAGLGRRVVIFLPALVQAIVVVGNVITISIAIDAWNSRTYGRMSLQVVFLVCVACLCKLASFYSADANRRWRKAFDRINPGLRHVEPPLPPRWIAIRQKKKDATTAALHPLMTELAYSLCPAVPPTRLETTRVEADIEVGANSPRITQEKLRAMATELQTKIANKVHGTPERYQTTKNTIEGARWFVELECEYRPAILDPKAAPGN